MTKNLKHKSLEKYFDKNGDDNCNDDDDNDDDNDGNNNGHLASENSLKDEGFSAQTAPDDDSRTLVDPSAYVSDDDFVPDYAGIYSAGFVCNCACARVLLID